jgi:hypothetical protein
LCQKCVFKNIYTGLDTHFGKICNFKYYLCYVHSSVKVNTIINLDDSTIVILFHCGTQPGLSCVTFKMERANTESLASEEVNKRSKVEHPFIAGV